MNFLQIAQRLHRESGRSTPPPTSVATATIVQQRMFDAINDAWQELQAERGKDWKWMRNPLVTTLTVGQSQYTGAQLGAPSFGRWRPQGDDYFVRCSPVGSTAAWWDVEYVALDEFKACLYDVLPSTSTPTVWTALDDQSLRLWPIPAATYGIRIDTVNAATQLVADADTPNMPEEFHMLLLWKALMDGAITDAAPEVLQKASMHHDKMRGRLVLDQGRLPCL